MRQNLPIQLLRFGIDKKLGTNDDDYNSPEDFEDRSAFLGVRGWGCLNKRVALASSLWLLKATRLFPRFCRLGFTHTCYPIDSTARSIRRSSFPDCDAAHVSCEDLAPDCNAKLLIVSKTALPSAATST